MGPWLFVEASIAVLLLTAVLARADSPFGQPSNTPAKAPPVTNPTPNSAGTPNAQPTARGPSSIDTSNTYHSTGAGFNVIGSPQTKEPVIDGKTIPKTIDFSAPTTPDQSPKPKKRAAPKKSKGRRNNAEKPEVSSKDDDGL